ncbi:1-deoxy-D-xylulose-5-phosphate synthase (plasmid) [Nocardia sp. CA-084685]|uniref:1-deoxy-D-xylulose-5-phosphate synthase n=1 Tax=Nocardia sp. CA-084685 TaxID=3239970 RepID=UPI003D977841
MTATHATGSAHVKPVVLDSLSVPEDIARLDSAQLRALADAIRAHLIRTVAVTGGHLGASLGMVELTIALHRVFNSPKDPIIFDTGHQAYAHKMLTGRAGQFHTLRRRGGLSGYPSRAESEHDWLESSHASVSIARGHGLARGFHLLGDTDRRVVVVIGDGALTGGVAWEGLNILGADALPLIVVVNDNGRSYDPTVGGIATHLAQLRDGTSGAGNLFEALGFEYVGPVDGHDIDAVTTALKRAQNSQRPTLVHAITKKGKGYGPAETDAADRMHACGPIDPATGQPTAPPTPTWTDVFEGELTALSERYPRIVAATAGMRLPTGLGTLSAAHPNRVFDSGIAEQHTVAAAAGIASSGLHPVVAMYSTFLPRALDQVLYDVGLHQAAITLVLDRAGITGPDGPSHHGLWDLVLLSSVPGMRIACPRDPERLRALLREAVEVHGPTALRFPKAPVEQDIPAIAQIDGIDILFRSPRLPLDILIVAVGAMAAPCLAAAADLTARGTGVTVVDPRWVTPVNPSLVGLVARHRATVTVEDGYVDGGIGARIVHAVTERSPHSPVAIRTLGVPAGYLPHASRAELLNHCGLTSTGIIDDCRTLLDALPDHAPATTPPAVTWSAP